MRREPKNARLAHGEPMGKAIALRLPVWALTALEEQRRPDESIGTLARAIILDHLRRQGLGPAKRKP